MVFVCVYFSGCPVHLSNFTAPPSDPREIYLEICCSDRISCCCRCYLSKHSTLEPRDFRGQVQQLNSQRPLAPAPCPCPFNSPCAAMKLWMMWYFCHWDVFTVAGPMTCPGHILFAISTSPARLETGNSTCCWLVSGCQLRVTHIPVPSSPSKVAAVFVLFLLEMSDRVQ